MKKRVAEKDATMENIAVVIGVIVILVLVAGILLIGHGSKTGSSTTALQTTTPQVAVNSAYLDSQFGLASLDISYGPTGNYYYAYLATTLAQQEEGYMNSTSLGGCKGYSPCIGMIFVFSNYTNLCFWMKDTPIPLKQVWLDQNGTVTAIYNATPYSTVQVCHYGQMVLETSPSQQMGLGWSVTPLAQTSP